MEVQREKNLEREALKVTPLGIFFGNPLLRPHISYKVGDGRALSLWFDPWLPTGPICSSLDARVIYDSGLTKNAKVGDIIHNGSWVWPGVNTLELMELRELTSTLSPPNSSQVDKILWDSKSEFSVRQAWEVIRECHQEVQWHPIVWFKSHIPRYSFFLWLAIHHKLSTQDRLWGTSQPSRCYLCEHDVESHSHLFFRCCYTERMWMSLLQKLGLQCFATEWDDVVGWCVAQFSGHSLFHLLGRLGVAALVYFIWRERNARLHDQSSMDASLLLKQVESAVRLRLMTCKPFANTGLNRHLVQVWSLPSSILRE